ncbi:regulatory protein NosR [Advenella sp. WQ 585]|uniref:Regulatory protein NosR n=2 Tax=Advenella mandrilli TaxID=2800330 RepID=A0ABS1EGQ6_9BURK|nr:regulatory protein NosR [Advenella mandrilli]
MYSEKIHPHNIKYFFSRFLILFVLLAALGGMSAPMAQALPEFLDTLVPEEIFPGADRFGPAEGKPMVARAYANNKQIGYVYLTTDIVNTRGYSSKPIDVVVGLDSNGTIVGAKLVRHHEPIVLIGIPQSKVDNFIQGYVGLNMITTPRRPNAPPPVDIISGATVTLMVIGDSITRSVMAVARHYNIGKPHQEVAQAIAEPVQKRIIDMSLDETKSWDALLEEGAVRNLHISIDDVNKTFEQTGRQGAIDKPEKGDPDDTFINLYAAVVSVPSIGRSLLGDAEWNHLRDRLKPGQQAILVAGEGVYSFKGSGYVRGGIFDRIEVIQQEGSFRFTDLNHQRIADLMAAGAPTIKEIALFTVPESAGFFEITEPWRLQLMVQRVLNVREKAFVTFDLDYELPQAYTIADPDAPVMSVTADKTQPSTTLATSATTAAGAPATVSAEETISLEDAEAYEPLWKQIWKSKVVQITIVVIALVLLAGVFFFQETLAKHPVFYDRFRLVFLTFSLFYIGWFAQAQLSVVNVLTFTSSLRTDFQWEYFLMDPIVFILWCATAISMVFWNRGAFCGWLCPFGSLQELLNRIAKKIGIKQVNVPHGVHSRMAAIKYVIFVVLFGFSLYELSLAEQLAEVEPFKTAIILKFIRTWPFVLFAVLLLLAGLFIERFYCRYLCPLGAALAIPAKMRIFDWLRRYKTCGNPCQRCANECPVQAIHPEGDINPNECIQCLHCQMLYHHEEKCPHLIQKNSKRKRTKAPPPQSLPQETVVRFIPNAGKTGNQ